MFQFRLQQVLDLREQRERTLASQLVEAMCAQQLAQGQLDHLQAARHANAEQVSESGQMRTVGQLASLTFVIQQLDNHIESANEVVSAAESKVSQAQGALHQAHRDRRVLARLRERHEEDYRTAEDHTDRRTMDDLAISRYTQSVR